MRLGILEAGRPGPDMAQEHGTFPSMFRRLLQAAGLDYEEKVYAVFEGRFPGAPDSCDAWLVTGSPQGAYDPHPWIADLKVFLRDAYEAEVPIVGICFGHQILAEALGGKVVKSERGWGCGVHRYELLERPEWLADAPAMIAVQAHHQDQVVEPPPGARVIARSEFCPIAGLAYGDRAISFQPHPEFDVGYAQALIDMREGRVIPDDTAAAARATLHDQVNSALIARWIVAVLQGRRDRAQTVAESAALGSSGFA